MKIIYFLLPPLWCWTASSYTVEDCPPQIHYRANLHVTGDSCYQVNFHRKSKVFDAQRTCQRFGGNLASVKSLRVNAFLFNHIVRGKSKYTTPMLIGLSFNKTDERFSWKDGEEMSFSNFDSKVDKVKFVAIDPQSSKWISYNVSSDQSPLYNFICEYPLANSSSSAVRIPRPGEQCPPGLSRDKNLRVYKDKCYLFGLTMTSYGDAETICQSNNGRLATAKSQDINDFFYDELVESYQFVKKLLWIGVSYDEKAEAYFFSDGEKLGKYNNFAYFRKEWWKDHPLTLFSTQTGYWTITNRLPGAVMQGYICEYSFSDTLEVTPTPAISVTKPTDRCPPGLSRDKYLRMYQDKCYFFGLTTTTYNKAEKICRSNNGRLASAKSQKINDFLFVELVRRYKFLEKKLWIGVAFDERADAYIFSDGEKLEKDTNLAPRIPKELAREFPLIYLSTRTGRWGFAERLPFVEMDGYICEYEASD